jgi:hypothetical protein
MSIIEYHLHIRVAGTAGELHDLRRLAAADPDLTKAQAATIPGIIDRRFSALNARTIGKQTPRWS